MAFSRQAREYAFERLERLRAEASDRAETERRELYMRLPALAEYDNEISSLGMSLTRAALRADAGIDSIQNEINEKIKNRARYIRERGAVEPRMFHSCGFCEDTGYREGRLCDCAKYLMREYALSEINRVSPLMLSSFSDFSLDYYSSNPKDGYNGLSPRKSMENVFKSCVSFARGFPSGESLLMMGDAGLGKTHLALAVAGEVLNRGFEVVYCSAANIFKAVETEYYEERRSDETSSSLKRCDLLVLDDLGAEHVNAFTAAVIYDIVNTRTAAGRSTIYTTNITRQETLEARYGEKVSSRLIGCCRLLLFFGDDIRLLKKRL